MTVAQPIVLTGWAEIVSEGAVVLYLSYVDEGMISDAADTPANQQYVPDLLNADEFSITYNPQVWVWGDTSVSQASFGQLKLNNYLGQYDNLLAFDVRDSVVTIKLVPGATALLTGTAIASAQTVATAIIDDVTSDDEDSITITLKDTLSRLDIPLSTRFNPPYVDSSAANQMIPILLGSGRNLPPQSIDSAHNIYIIGDRPISNIATAYDKAAPLDPNASPPQYAPALNTTALQLASPAVGPLTVDASSLGQQVAIPGIADILAGSGAFPGTKGATAWLGQVGAFATTANGTVTIVAGVTYNIPVVSVTGLTIGVIVKVVQGANTIYGTINNVVGSAIRIPITGSTTTGTPTSITTGATVIPAGAPDGWTWSGTQAQIQQQLPAGYPFLGTNNMVTISTTDVFNIANGLYGDKLVFPTSNLIRGKTYRVSFSLYNVGQQQPFFLGGMVGGVIPIAYDGTDAENIYIAGQAPLFTPAFKSLSFTYEFTVPASNVDRQLGFIITPSAGNSGTTGQGTGSASIYGVKIELVGAFVSEPLSGIAVTDYFTEILVNRQGEAAAVFNATDTAALGFRVDGSQIPWGNYFTTPPKIPDALQQCADQFCACIFTDSTGVIRIKQLVDPSNPIGRTVVALFDDTCVKRPIQQAVDHADGLTTCGGARRNWKIFADSDFVTDTSIVTANIKAAYMRNSQFLITSSRVPAGQYSVAIAADTRDFLFDLASDAQLELDRVVGIYSYNSYPDGTASTGKRRLVTFDVYFDDITKVGSINGAQTNINNLIFGAVVQFNYPAHGYNNVFGVVVGWQPYPFAGKITLTVLI